MKLQARQIIRTAKRLGIKLARENQNVCALAPPAIVAGFKEAPWFGPFSDDIQINRMAEFFGVKPVDLAALEAGFEKCNFSKYDIGELKKSRYYKVGVNTANKAGLN